MPNCTGLAKKLRKKLKQNLQKKLGLCKNKATGIVASISGNSLSKIASDKAIEKSKANGFSLLEHFEAAEKIVQLYENADLVESRPDKNFCENLVSIKRFHSPVTLQGEKKAVARLTVKESVQNGHKIYSLELTKQKPPTKCGGGRQSQKLDFSLCF